ncbi:protein trunk-like [Bradysia coprophila]|uniref:protein trunk-like n=1 Tax=Bradysia coprophila TaxID=38358 RepID=UPI00187DB053|nr:protein trunk-like [Bradysia coprophila]
MVFEHLKLVYILINLIMCSVHTEAKSISRKSLPKLTKLTKIVETEDVRATQSNCANLPPTVLSDVLGAAFNSRYMSIEPPKYPEEDMENLHPNSYQTKRNSELLQPFYVDDTFALEISDKPAWEVKHTVEEHDQGSVSISTRQIHHPLMNMNVDRSKRDLRRGNRMRNDRPWECEAKIKWIDLGADYFPRFLRSVECTKKKCWYNHYVCKPRSFTVKLLRRRNGECVQTNQLNRVTNNELPGDFKELWVWEERAVNFCCDCAAA